MADLAVPSGDPAPQEDRETPGEPWGSREVRDELDRLLRADLLGPWDGNEEAITGRVGPRDRYITGILAPLDAGDDEDQVGDDEDLDAGEFGDESDDKPVAGVSALRLFPSSMGATFTVDESVDSLHVVASWGRYEKVRPDDLISDANEPGDGAANTPGEGDAAGLVVNDADEKKSKDRPWRRRQIVGEHVIDLAPVADTVDGRYVDEVRIAPSEAPKVFLRWIVRTGTGGRRMVSVFLVNRQSKDEYKKSQGADASWMYQSAFEVTAVDGHSPVFVPSDAGLGFVGEGEDAEQAMLAMLYRNTPDYATGHGVAVAWDEGDDRTDRRATRIYTEALPSHDVPQTLAPTAADIPGFADLVLDMRALADAADGAECTAMLRPLVSSYRDWIGEQERKAANDPGLQPYRSEAAANLARAARAADRIEAGLDLLAADEQVWVAFRFMNQAMALQRQHTEAMGVRRTNPDVSFVKALKQVDVPAKRSWRPFQIAFVLLNLPALADPTNPERTAGGDGQPGMDTALADLLFFPTGGGKTEAYLGLTAFTFAMRRLQRTVAGLDGSRGIAVLMRYTLRLLTSQQLQRAATLVAAAEVLRRQDIAAGANLWGPEPFRIGLWVGGSVTPNRFDDALAYVESERGWGKKNSRASISPVPFSECPWCGTAISAKTDVEADKVTRRIHIYCGDTSGRCAFTQKRNADGLPVLTVDEEIYRHPPSLLIATVDKFAQLPRNGASGHLFGHVTDECSRHGFKHADIRDSVCVADRHNAQKGVPAASTTPATRLRPIDLIIQDELHLISDALGTMVGLYETAVDELATWEIDGKRIRPKVVASTATVRRAQEQAYALFRRQLAVFPPPGLDVEDSFFARQVPVDDAHPGRRYLGVCAQGIRLKTVEIRVTAAIMSFAQMLFDDHGSATDPYMTLVGYFNALRELGGMRRLVEDDIAARLRRPMHQDLPGRTAPMPRRRTPLMEELTSRVSSRSIKDTLKAIDVTFDPDEDTTAARAAAAVARKAAGKKKDAPTTPPRPLARDVVLATSMFGVGVDIPRLGLMTVTGQPKATSEYIQATSRVGRDPSRPGLVVTIYNWARPRDLSHYERFGHYHAAFYQQVEALSVTPFSIPAINRAITGAFLGALRHLQPAYNPDTGLNAVTADSPEVARLIDVFADRAAAITGSADVANDVRAMLNKRLQHLASRRDAAEGQSRLAYRGGKDGAVRVLRDPESGIGWDMWTVPNSLRETEPEINLQLLSYDPAIEDESVTVPRWRPPGAHTDGGGDSNV